MVGAYAKQLILVVLDLLGYLMILSGFSLQLCNCLPSNSGPGPILFLCGYLSIYAVQLCRQRCFPTYYFLSYLTASNIQLFGLSLAVYAQFCFFISCGNKFFTWLGLAGSYIMVVGGLLYAWNLYEMQTNTWFRRYLMEREA